jgi:hypothetical protein
MEKLPIVENICEWLGRKIQNSGGYRIILRGYAEEATKYLGRHYLFRTNKMGVFLHRYWRGDRDDPHDHPWDSVSIPLFPGFFETVMDKNFNLTKHWRKPFHIYYRKATDAHFIELAEGMEGRTWSLFIHFKRERVWGFWPKIMGLATARYWLDFKTYGKQILNQNVESAVNPEDQPDYMVKGVILPKVVYSR